MCGGREFDDWGLMCSTLDEILFSESRPLTIIEGGAKGADFLGRVWAKLRSCPYKEYPADWKTHGGAAGPIRNKQMLEEGKPDLVVAFAGGSGTRDMIRQAEKAGVKVVEVSWRNQTE